MLETFELLKSRFEQDPFPSLKVRTSRLKALKNLLDEYSPQLCQAISEDFGYRSADETKLTEIFPLRNQIKYTLDHLSLWSHEDHRPVEWLFQSAQAKVIHVPLGLVGIIAPWNFPLYLALSPLIAALAGGNSVMLKMSELVPKTTLVLQEALHKYLGDCTYVIAGDPEVNKRFCEISFDHLFFTGSPEVGSLVMQAAAKNLTPVTLELGGKSPVFAAPDANFRVMAERVLWGKTLNAGQICVAPDYVLCPEDKLSLLIDELQAWFHKHYPTGIENGPYTSIINKKHLDRLKRWLKEAEEMGAKIIPLSKDIISAEPRKLAPHLIINPSVDSKVMQEEIFGPLLPIITYSQFEETRKYLNLNPHPLVIYLFTKDKKIIADFQRHTSSGGLCINDTIVHLGQDHLPFGGVRSSGMGNYHGVEGFLTFTRPKAVFQRGRFSLSKLLYPPYTGKILRFFYWLMGIH